MNPNSHIPGQAVLYPLQALAARHTLVMLQLQAEYIMSDNLSSFIITFLTIRNPFQLPADIFLVERFPKPLAGPDSQAHSCNDLLGG